MRLFISALPLELGAVGISSYTGDLLAAIANSQIADKTTILCPPWLDDHPTITSSEIRVEILNNFGNGHLLSVQSSGKNIWDGTSKDAKITYSIPLVFFPVCACQGIAWSLVMISSPFASRFISEKIL